MSEEMQESERWRLGWLQSYNAVTGAPERFVYRPGGDDVDTRICVRGDTCDDDARRMVASVNACLKVPVETLEAGVVAVPAEVVRRMIDTNRLVDAVGGEYHMIDTADIDVLRDAFARLVQNGGAADER